ncbi:MAG: four helix bundle protein [Candidatus Levyibacteriota bacterium]
MNIIPHIPKTARYTIGTRIENKFLDLLELSYIAYFIEKEKKLEIIAKCVFELDILKFLISTSWDAKCISHKQYEDIALKLDEIGKMLWGWKKSLDPDKKNRAR